MSSELVIDAVVGIISFQKDKSIDDKLPQFTSVPFDKKESLKTEDISELSQSRLANLKFRMDWSWSEKS